MKKLVTCFSLFFFLLVFSLPGCGSDGGGQTLITSLSSVFPSSGSLSGGYTVTIRGTGFLAGNLTADIDGRALTGINIVNNFEFTGVVPPGNSTGPKDVTVTTDTGTASTTGAFTYTADITPPSFSGIKSITPLTSTSLLLRWDPATDIISDSEDIRYRIYLGTSSGNQNFSSPAYTTLPGQISFQAGGLAPGTTYYFIVRPVDEAGNVNGNNLEGSGTTRAQANLGWRDGTFLKRGRKNHTSTLLNNGKVLIAGGIDSTTSAATNLCEIYDPATGLFDFTRDGGGNQSAMNVARVFHTATLLPSGKVLLAGGMDDSGNTLNSAEVYDPSSGTFALTTDGNSVQTFLQQSRRHHTATLLDSGTVLIAGGLNSSGTALDSTEIFNGSTGTFLLTQDSNSQTTTMNTPRAFHTSTLLPEGKVFLAGGEDNSSTVLDSGEIFDPTTGLFALTEDSGGNVTTLGTARKNHTATLLPDGTVLLAGGEQSGVISQGEIFNPSDSSYSNGGVLNSGRKNHSATLLPDGRVVVTGGEDTSPVASTELYQFRAGTFLNVKNLSTGRFHHRATLLASGQVLVTGGDNGGPLAATELFDSSQGGFVANPDDMQVQRGYGFTATLLTTGKVLIVGGFDGSISRIEAESYDPLTLDFSTSSLDTLQIGRRFHTATLLPDGRVVILGGDDGDPNDATRFYYDSGEIYHPSSQDFEFTTDSAQTFMSTERSHHTATLLNNGTVLVAGGESNNGTATSSTEIFDPSDETFDLTRTSTNTPTTLNDERSRHTATLLPSGKVLIAGGADQSDNALNRAEIYDPSSGDFTTLSVTMKAPRFHHTATLLPSGKVLITGGESTNSTLNSAEIFDPAGPTFSWTFNLNTGSQTKMSQSRKGHSATFLPGGRVLLAGGEDDGGNLLKAAEIFDPTTGEFIGVKDMVHERKYHTATLLPSGQVLIAGGENNSGTKDEAEIFYPGLGFADNWRPQIIAVSNTTHFPVSINFGSKVTATGQNFRGLSPGAGGSSQSSATGLPLALLLGLDSGNYGSQMTPASPLLILSPQDWSDSAFDFETPLSINNPGGPYLLFTVANGIPSRAKIIRIQ